MQFFSNRTHQTKVGMALSEIANLTSGVIQGSGIGPVMLIIFIDDLSKLLENYGISIKLFADDVKLYLKIDKVNDAGRLQVALDLLSDWANEWQLSVPVSKCSVLNIRHAPCNVNFSIAGCALPNVNFCRDLGVTMTSTLSISRHINDIATKAHQRANCILGSFVSGDVALLVRAFTVYVRPIVEYNSVIWSPQTKLEIKNIEKVQRRFTKRIMGFNCIKYEQRISKLVFWTLVLRRLHIDLIFCYKIVFGLVSVNFYDFFTFRTVTNTRGHKYKLYKSHCQCNTRRFFFAERVIN